MHERKRHEESRRLAEQQYKIAAQYPGEYVILRGRRVLYHGTDRDEADRVWREGWKEYLAHTSPHAPAAIGPDRTPSRRPTFRGRDVRSRYSS